MEQEVQVASTTVGQGKLERIFDALREHHWLGIPKWYRPSIERFGPTDGPVASYEQVVHDLMASNSLPQWFKEQFVWEKPDITVRTLF